MTEEQTKTNTFIDPAWSLYVPQEMLGRPWKLMPVKAGDQDVFLLGFVSMSDEEVAARKASEQKPEDSHEEGRDGTTDN